MNGRQLVTNRLPTAVGDVVLTRGGSGPPLVYLHSAQGETVDLVAPFLEALEGYEIFAPMFPGFAGSEGLGAIEDMEDAVYHCLDLFNRLGIGKDNPPHLVGLSLGGWMAAEIASRYPERARTITLVNAAGLYLQHAPIRELFGRKLDELADEVYADKSHPVYLMAQQLGAMSIADAAALPFDLIRPFFEAQAATAKLAWNPYLHNPKLPRHLAWITAPTLVVAGSADGFIPNAHAEAYAAGIPGARLEIVAGGGHMLPLEQPRQLAELVSRHAGAH
ncbi:MAG TPA: alpha/beta hydrolase [Acidimicrobiales bacterium]|nr:alpha/beta hydrolase [Acidimicrobiales bacterium]